MGFLLIPINGLTNGCIYIYITGVISPMEIHGENVRAVHIHLKGKLLLTEFTWLLMTLHVNLHGCESRYLAVFVWSAGGRFSQYLSFLCPAKTPAKPEWISWRLKIGMPSSKVIKMRAASGCYIPSSRSFFGEKLANIWNNLDRYLSVMFG